MFSIDIFFMLAHLQKLWGDKKTAFFLVPDSNLHVYHDNSS